MGIFHCAGRGHELVVEGLIPFRRLMQLLQFRQGAVEALEVAGGGHDTGIEGPGVDLVEGQPVFHLALILGENDLAEIHVEVDQAAVRPAVVLLHQGVGQLVVGNGHQRLDSVLLAAVKHLVIKCQSLLVGFRFLASGEDASPVDGQPEAFEAHFREEGDVLS